MKKNVSVNRENMEKKNERKSINIREKKLYVHRDEIIFVA